MNATQANTFDHHRGTSPLLQPIRLWRAMVFVGINVMGFGVVSAFWQYLSTGKWLNFDAFFRNLFLPLGAAFLEPLSVFTHPSLVPVYGLLLGVTVFVPILVSILYRLRVAVVFIVVLVFVAQMPLLALAVVTGCIMTGHTPLRSNMPMAAALLGMLPAVIYVAVLGCPTLAGTTDRDYWATVEPFRRWVLYGPYVLALVSAIVGSAVVLALAKATKFRPGVVWPVLLVLSAAPMVAFYVRVGPAELQYSLIAHRLMPGDAVFPELTLDQWLRDHPSRTGMNAKPVTQRVEEDLLTRRDDLSDRCEQFLARYPHDARAPEVMWVQAQCRSLQLDQVAYRANVIRSTCAFVLAEAQPAWRGLLETYPHSPQAVLARWRLAQLALRNDTLPPIDRLHAADELLREAATGLAEHQAAESAAGTAPARWNVFTESRALPQCSYYARALHKVHELQRLIEQNALAGDPDGIDLLAAWLNIDPASPDAGREYEKLADQNEGASLANNLRLAAALAERDALERARKLLPLADVQIPTDTTAQAAFELALIQAEGIEEIEGVLAEEVYLKAVIAAPANPWQGPAAARLKLLQITQEISP